MKEVAKGATATTNGYKYYVSGSQKTDDARESSIVTICELIHETDLFVKSYTNQDDQNRATKEKLLVSFETGLDNKQKILYLKDAIKINNQKAAWCKASPKSRDCLRYDKDRAQRIDYYAKKLYYKNDVATRDAIDKLFLSEEVPRLKAA